MSSKSSNNKKTSSIMELPSPSDVESKLKNFSELLDTLASVDEKKKSLWREIYVNSVEDRRNAVLLFTDLYNIVHGTNTEHAMYGQILVKYLESMNKSNAQLLKLAEIIGEVQVAEGQLDDDSIYDQIGDLTKRQ